jgi:hypothetical protein
MYISEVRELVDSLLYRVGELEAARDKWLENERIATKEANSNPREFEVDRFNEALWQTGHQQATIFEVLEVLLAAWARLSLLFYPVRLNDKKAPEKAEWRRKRGEILCEVLDIPAASLLAKREFRNSWMHFDERMDRAYWEERLGNRQQFVLSAGVAAAVERSVRVIDVEALVFHYRNEEGTLESVSVHDLKELLLLLTQKLTGYGNRLNKLPLRPR